MSQSNEVWDPAFTRLARALFGAYNHHSGGKAWDGKPVPTWSEIVTREHDKAETYPDRRDDIRPDGVPSHWRYVASSVCETADAASAHAELITLNHQDSEVFNRVIQ